METCIASRFESVLEALGSVSGDVVGVLESGAARDDDVLAALRAAGVARRLTDVVTVAAAARVEARSAGPRDERLSTRCGEAGTAGVVRAVTRCSGRTSREVAQAARWSRRELSLTTGELLPGAFPELGAALRDGVIGIDGYLAAIRPLVPARSRIAPDVLAAADAALAASARGVPPAGSGDVGPVTRPAPVLGAQELERLARAWAAYADPDGAAPAEERAMRARGLSLGAERDGVVRVHGELLPDVAGQLVKLMDAILNPRTRCETGSPDHPGSPGGGADAGGGGERTSAQKRHDAFAVILGVAARSAESPSVGGAAPTVTLTMTGRDFLAGVGWARQDCYEASASWLAARQAACTGAVQRVIHDDNGRILSSEILDRVFNASQRRAIIARDRGCVIPGCEVRASWCEIHHVEEYANGGATCTDNGVLLCWFHHRTLGVGGWQVRMTGGVPQVRGPSWWDPDRCWRRAGSPLAGHGPPGS